MTTNCCSFQLRGLTMKKLLMLTVLFLVMTSNGAQAKKNTTQTEQPFPATMRIFLPSQYDNPSLAGFGRVIEVPQYLSFVDDKPIKPELLGGYWRMKISACDSDVYCRRLPCPLREPDRSFDLFSLKQPQHAPAGTRVFFYSIEDRKHRQWGGITLEDSLFRVVEW